MPSGLNDGVLVITVPDASCGDFVEERNGFGK